VVLALLVGCSGSTPDKPATDAAASPRPTSTPEPFSGMSNTKVLAEVKAAVSATTSVQVTGWHIDDKNQPRDANLKKTRDTNLKMTRGGKCFGTVSVDGSTLRLRRLGPVLYLKAGRDYWNYLGNPLAARLANRWLKVRKGFSKEFDLYFAMTRPEYWLKEWMDPQGAEELRRENGIVLDGVQTTALGEGIGSLQLSSAGGLFIASTGPALPREVRFGEPYEDVFTFRNWNTTVVNVVAPRNALEPGTVGLVGQ
jgi:hypothetical protein